MNIHTLTCKDDERAGEAAQQHEERAGEAGRECHGGEAVPRQRQVCNCVTCTGGERGAAGEKGGLEKQAVRAMVGKPSLASDRFAIVSPAQADEGGAAGEKGWAGEAGSEGHCGARAGSPDNDKSAIVSPAQAERGVGC